jgi:hypothetical protein
MQHQAAVTVLADRWICRSLSRSAALLRMLCTLSGEMGSELATKDDLKYYVDAASFATAQGDLAQQTAPVAGWFWWSFNANSMGEPHEHGLGWMPLRLAGL